MAILLRISSHQLEADQERRFRNTFGSDLKFVTEVISFGSDPVSAVRALIERVESESNDEVVAIEAQASNLIVMRLIDQRRNLNNVVIIRAQLK